MGELLPAPEIDLDQLDGQLVVSEAWVRATAILLRAQERRLARQQEQTIYQTESPTADDLKDHDQGLSH